MLLKSTHTALGDVVVGGRLVVVGRRLKLENLGRDEVLLPLPTKDDPGRSVDGHIDGSVLRMLGREN